MNKVVLKFIFYISILSFFVACTRTSQYSFSLFNNTNSSIKVIYKTTNNVLDSFNLHTRQSKTLLIYLNQEPSVTNYEINKMSKFDNILCFKNDSMKSPSNFLIAARWYYKEHTKLSAEYTLTIEESDF